MESIEEFAESLKPHPDNAQILLEAGPKEGTFKRIINVLEPIGINIVRCDRVSEKRQGWLLLQLSSQDMREAALKLSEAGFKQVRGINAKRERKNGKPEKKS